jgi:hypothetical protein
MIAAGTEWERAVRGWQQIKDGKRQELNWGRQEKDF